MVPDPDASLSDEATFAGAAKRRPAAEMSLGDERTLGDGRGDNDTIIDDIEVVDLEARYRVEGTLGQGGMGAVLLATDTRLDRKVAIKRILGEAAGNRMAVQRFLTEAKSIAALNHPNIVQIYDYGRAKDGPFLIMEYVDGGSLLDRCRENALPHDEAIDLACQLCDGLAKAHDLGIIHRDIKPANVLLSKDGIPKLTDFGLAKSQAGDHGQTMTGAVLGTPDFMSPEQRRGSSLVDHRSDLWSLAATVYQMVTGRSPKVIRLHELPQALQAVMARALEDAKDARYQSAREMRDALKASLRSATPLLAAVVVGEGQCPSCGAQNDVARKFCRGCGATLEAACLGCSDAIPMWEEICGKCGSKQTPLVEARRVEMAADQAKAEGLLGDFEFTQAGSIATSLRDEPNPRLSHLREWAEQFLRDIDKGRQEQVSRASTAVMEALAHEKAYDYAAGVRALDPLPHAVRALTLPTSDVTAGALLDRLDQKLRTSQSLESTIRAAIKGRALSGLLTKVIALASLRPDRRDLAKLREQLEQRQASLARQRDVLVQQARQAITKQDYATAIKLLSQVDDEVATAEVGQLRTDARQREDRFIALRDRIKAGIAANEYRELSPTIEEYLTLKPLTPELEGIRAQAIAEERQMARRKRMQRVMVASAVICVIASWIGMQAWRNARERHFAAIEAARAKHAADIEAALQAGKWDDVISLDSENAQAYVGRAKEWLETSPPDVESAFADIERASRIGIDEEALELKSLKAKAHSSRAMNLASDGRLEDAAKDLAAAKELGAGWTVLRGAEDSICSGWVARAERASSEGNLPALQAATTALEKFPKRSVDELQKWWLRLGVVGGERGDTVAVQEAIQAARGLGAADDIVAPLQARQLLIEAISLAAKHEMSNAVVKAVEASLLDVSVATAALQKPANLSLRQAVVASYQTKFDAAVAGARWDEGLQIAATASAIDDNASGWVGLAIASYPGGLVALPPEVLGRLPAATVAALPPSSFAELSPAAIATLPPACIAVIPPTVLAALPPLRNSIGMELKLIPAGTFTMGQVGGKADEKPHEVTLSKPFYLGVCEVTINELKWVSGSKVGELKKDGDRPVNVTWYDAVGFCQKLSELPEEQLAGRVYRLPTEAEWEYACRAGAATAYSFGDDENQLGDYGWFRDGSLSPPRAVGGKKPNSWGLYDMHGNIMEWCSDWYADYADDAVTDPLGPSSGSSRIVRGGDCRIDDPQDCRSADRGEAEPSSSNWGFRIALPIPKVAPK